MSSTCQFYIFFLISDGCPSRRLATKQHLSSTDYQSVKCESEEDSIEVVVSSEQHSNTCCCNIPNIKIRCPTPGTSTNYLENRIPKNQDKKYLCVPNDVPLAKPKVRTRKIATPRPAPKSSNLACYCYNCSTGQYCQYFDNQNICPDTDFQKPPNYTCLPQNAYLPEKLPLPFPHPLYSNEIANYNYQLFHDQVLYKNAYSEKLFLNYFDEKRGMTNQLNTLNYNYYHDQTLLALQHQKMLDYYSDYYRRWYQR